MAESASDAVIGAYGSMKDAENAVRVLLEQGVPAWEVSILGQDLRSETQVHGFVTTGDSAKAGARSGAWVGGLFAVLTGSALLFIPGVGALVILGPLAAGAVSAAEGAAVGGGLGAVLGHFITPKHIPTYRRHLEAGHYLVLRHRPKAEDIRLLERRTTPVDPVEHHQGLVTAGVMKATVAATVGGERPRDGDRP